MTSKWRKTVAFACALGACGCGNYSNDDVDFELAQKAMPQQDDIAAKLQVSVDRVDSAEYYKATRDVVLTFNTLIVDLTAIIEAVRAYPPTSRNGAQRTWGPFPDKGNPGWEIRIVMQRSTTSDGLLRIDYWAQLRKVGQDDTAWVSLLVGEYTSQGGISESNGEIHFNVGDARAVSYPAATSDPGLAKLDHLSVSYSRIGFPIQVAMQIVNVATESTKQANYTYERQEDNSGSMQFQWQGTTDEGLQVTATMLSRWLPTGEGRADLVADLTPNLPGQTTLGTDCWGSDTVATYVFRLDGSKSLNDPSLCVY